jgi:hypothetical protein
MNKYILLFFVSILFFNTLTAQSKVLQITNLETKNEKIIEENARIKLVKTNGLKLKGRLHIKEDLIYVDNVQVKLEDVAAIKRNPLLVSVLTSGVFIYLGMVTAGIGALIGVLGEAAGFLLIVPGAAMIYLGVKPPNFSKNYKNVMGWQYEIITITD